MQVWERDYIAHDTKSGAAMAAPASVASTPLESSFWREPGDVVDYNYVGVQRRSWLHTTVL